MTVEELAAQIEYVESTKGGSMDTKTLVVGQEVYLVSGIYGKKGRVVEVTPSGVMVQTEKVVAVTPSGMAETTEIELVRFNTNGKETDFSRRDRLGFGPSHDDKFLNMLWEVAPEFQPWELITEEEERQYQSAVKEASKNTAK